MIVPAASSMKGDALTASSFVSSQCSPEASQYFPTVLLRNEEPYDGYGD